MGSRLKPTQNQGWPHPLTKLAGVKTTHPPTTRVCSKTERTRSKNQQADSKSFVHMSCMRFIQRVLVISTRYVFFERKPKRCYSS